MENANFNQLVSFLFGIANDCLVDVYDVGDYRKIILPMIVLRRFDAVLEPTKQAVLAMKQINILFQQHIFFLVKVRIWGRMLHCVPLHTRRSAIVRLLHCPI